MLHKTVESFDTLSIQTKTFSSKPASFHTTSKRDMFRNKASNNSQKVQMEISNMLVMQPEYSSFVIQGMVYFLESTQSFVSITDFHYCLMNDRSKPVLIPRNCEPGSQLIYSNATKPGVSVNLLSVHRFSNQEYPCMIHVNITKYNPSQQKQLQSKDIYRPYDNSLEPFTFIPMQNFKKGLLISLKNNNGQAKQYQLLYINMTKSNKIKNPKHASMIKQNIFSFSSTVQPNEDGKKEQKQYLYNQIDTITHRFKFQLGEHIVAAINSQFGDSVLIATNLQIYQVQIEGRDIVVRGLDFRGKLKKFLHLEDMKETIVDLKYIIDGLKVIFLTSSGIVGYIEAQNIHFAKSVHDILASSNKKQQCQIKQVHPLIGKLAFLTQQNSILIMKVSQSQCSFQKKVDLPINTNESIEYNINLICRHDQLVLQKITKQQKNMLNVSVKNLLSSGNQFTKIYQSMYYQHPQKYISPIKIVNSKANSISCILKQNTLHFYKLGKKNSFDQHPVEHLFSKTFFQKPIYISIDPYASNIIILFREFVKFYKFRYNDLTQYYTYNVRNVCYAGYSDNGNFIIISVEDMLYFLNPFSFETINVIEMYGDIKSIRFYDDMFYVISKPKAAKNITETLILQAYSFQKQQYKKIHQFKLQPFQALLTSHKFCIIASNKNISVYRRKIQTYQQPEKSKFSKDYLKKIVIPEDQIELLISKNIKFNDAQEYPTFVFLLEEFGILLIGTTFGRVYEYIWPFTKEEELEHFKVFSCSASQITKIQVDANYQKIYIFSKNTSITQMEIIQYVEGEEMPNVYIINPKTLYESQKIKYEFANREYLYQEYTSYIYQDLRQTNQNIEQYKFMLQKLKDDIEEHIAKTGQKFTEESKDLNSAKEKELRFIKQNTVSEQKKYQIEIKELKESLKINEIQHKQKKKKEKEKYQKTLLELYKEANRLRGIYKEVDKQQTKQRDIYLLQNQKVINKLKKEADIVEQQYQVKFDQINKNNMIYQLVQNDQNIRQIYEQFEEYNEILRKNANDQLEDEERKKEYLLGSNGARLKQIISYRRRRDEFEALIMETNLQMDELKADKEIYIDKKEYLVTELEKKQKIIEEKQKQLIKLIDKGSMMKKLKQTHQFELNQYEKEFEPILSKINKVDQEVKKMNDEILKEYLDKVEKDTELIDKRTKYQKLKALRQKKIKIKLDTNTKVQRFLASLSFLVEKPSDKKLQDDLNILSSGQKLEINEEQVRKRIQNAKLIRKKQFIGKQIEEHQKRQQQMLKNNNDITRHFNENTMLVREYNNLTQLNKKLLDKLQQIQLKFKAAKVTRLQTPKKKVSSVHDLRKFSEKKMTPFQRHEMQFNDMFTKGNTIQTRLPQSSQSRSLLKSLIRDVEGTDSKFQKMEIIRERIKSFVNPEIRIRKTLVTQRVLFDKMKGDHFQ